MRFFKLFHHSDGIFDTKAPKARRQAALKITSQSATSIDNKSIKIAVDKGRFL